jgi:hypothetical protein
MVNIFIQNILQKEKENDIEPKRTPKALMLSRGQQKPKGGEK